MLSGCWIIATLLLLTPAMSLAQSGDSESDTERTLSCTSHIMTEASSLTCKLVGGRIDDVDDEDVEADGISNMTACYKDLMRKKQKCFENDSDTINFKRLPLMVPLNLTVESKGRKITKMIDLRKIVKPRSPKVWNVTLDQKSKQAIIYIHIPYHKEYLKAENQLFQLLLRSPMNYTIQNITPSKEIVMKISMDRLQMGTMYELKVRSIPQVSLQGTWSEWSELYSFVTPVEEGKPTEITWEIYTGIVFVIIFLLLTTSVIFWKHKIFTYMWPSIPHPKYTLVHICSPNTGLLLNVKPEVFSALKVCSLERTDGEPCQEVYPSTIAAAADSTRSTLPCSAQSLEFSSCAASVSTEELELSMQLSRSSSEAEDSFHSTSPSPISVHQLQERPPTPPIECSDGGNEAEVIKVGKQEEAYVTMSSFYQIK